ncbi:STY1053 family phage-associated protein [Superficieibacter sp. BNK-5]|uniref:STY1053 family phage-associated protein n=1 Tax=Superficieibacter sp. BNK-5 TaxID=3376142 RepID=UPI0039BF3480
MSKKTIRVHTPFTFSSEDGTSQHFEAGEHTVEENVAGHWFVLAHAEVSGKAQSPADSKETQAQIDSLTAQLADKDRAYALLQQSSDEKDATIADLTAQLAALQAPVNNPAAEGNDDAKKPKSASNK